MKCPDRCPGEPVNRPLVKRGTGEREKRKFLSAIEVACERQTFLLAHRRWETFCEEEKPPRETSLSGDERGETSAVRRLRSKRCWSLCTTGTPSSKFENRRASPLLRDVQNFRICMGKKPIVSVTYENERISIQNSLPYLKCVLRLSCVVHGRSIAVLWVFM